MKRCFLLVLFFITIFPIVLSGQEAHITAVDISWEKGMITFDVTAPFPDKAVSPATRFRLEQKILQQAPKMIVEACRNVALDSWYTVENRIQEDPDLFRSLEKLAAGLDHSYSRPTENNSSLTIRFVLPIFPDLAGLFFIHESARSHTAPPGYLPTSEFTGIIILAEGSLPEKGSDGDSAFNPSVFPRILNEEMAVISDRTFVAPEYLSRWGVAGFAHGYELKDYEERIGTYPLRVSAREIFGRNHSDIILSSEDAARILGSENNRRLIREGRIVIIYSR